MSKKTKRRPVHTASPGQLLSRATRALREGRFEQALDAARALYDLDPTAHRELYVQAVLGRAEQLLSANQTTQPGTLAGRLWELVATADHKGRLAKILARCGNINRAWQLAQQLGDTAINTYVWGCAADAAIAGKLTFNFPLPAGFQAHQTAIIKAFSEVEAGHDDQARETLQAITLSSPFLEWKVLLRGLLAYYQRDDAKAAENWQRLNQQRLPAQLAAPFRTVVDPAFGAAQSQEARGYFQEALDRVEGLGMAGRLRTIQRHLANENHLNQAFKQAEELVPRVKAESPQVVARLANCFFWAIMDHGQPTDLERYKKLFGAPPEDPRLSRLEAMALEMRHAFDDAHEAWQDYEKSIANHASALPPGHADRMRSLIWRRMGNNAANMADSRGLPPTPFDPPHSRLKPDAETCYKRSLELAPDQLEAHDVLVRYYLKTKKLRSKATPAAKRLLKQFPNHAPTLELVGDLSLKKEKNAEAVDYLTRAARANPLDGRLRGKLSAAHAAVAEEHAAAKRFDKAREEFQAALTLREGAGRYTILCPWAACEFVADNPGRAEELLQQARDAQGHPLGIAFAMLVYAIRLKLGKAIKSRFDGEFKSFLDQKPEGAAAAALASEAALLRRSAVKYIGQQTHEKKILAYLGKARDAEFTESQLQQACDALTELKASRLIQSYFKRGQESFPNNPRFYLAETDYHLTLPPYRVSPPYVSMLLQKVRTLASALPQAERQALLEMVLEREEKLQAMNPFGGLLDIFGNHGFFDGPFGNEFGDEFDDDDDGGDWEDDW